MWNQFGFNKVIGKKNNGLDNFWCRSKINFLLLCFEKLFHFSFQSFEIIFIIRSQQQIVYQQFFFERLPRLFLLTIVFLKRLILAGSALRQSKQSLIEDFVNLWSIFHSSLEFDMKLFFVKEKLIGVMVHLLSF